MNSFDNFDSNAIINCSILFYIQSDSDSNEKVLKGEEWST